jgi:signal peptidase I
MSDSPYAPPAEAKAVERPPPSRGWALVLSLVATGAGHVYAGSWRRGIAWSLGLPIFGIGWLELLVRLHVGRVALFLALLVVVPWLAMVSDAYGTAGRPGTRGAAFLTRRYVVEAYKVPSGSMMPTLLDGDHFFVDKGRWTPRRGDVVVFPFPEHREQDFVKRVVGLPGNRIEFEDGFLVVDGARAPTCRLGAGSVGVGDGATSGDVYVEVLDGRAHLMIIDRSVPPSGHQGPWTVRPGEVFVAGDNRLNAYDSRMWFGGQGGGVPIASVRGSGILIWLSAQSENRVGMRFDAPELPAALEALQPALDQCLRELHVQ